MSFMKWVNLALRSIMELGIVIGLGYWGYQTGESDISRILLCTGAPLIGFGFWGAVDFHQLGRVAEPLRLIQELVISGLAALALYTAGAHVPGWMLALISVIHHLLVYLLGDRLLKQ